MLQYIIGGNNASKIIDLAQQALDNGCRWIRLDLSAINTNEIEATVKLLQEKCSHVEAFMTIENDVETAISMKMAGVHLGLNNKITALESRKKLGEEPVMGITIKHGSEIPFIPRSAVDYIAIENDSLEECSKVVEQMKAAGLDEPVVATFKPDMSLDSLFDTGINGIVVHHSTTTPPQIPILIDKVISLVEKRLSNI